MVKKIRTGKFYSDYRKGPEGEMEKLIIEGKTSLKGQVNISGSKNASLPIIAASLLIEGECHLKNVPQLTDVKVMSEIMERLGAKVEKKEGELKIDTSSVIEDEVPAELLGMLRASILILSPLLFRKRRAKLTLPGGCNIGKRPVDLHLKGLSEMGVLFEVNNGYIKAKIKSFLKGGDIHLNFPSVGATENLILAASVAKGETIIKNASQTPEVVDLCNFLQKAGVKIEGVGTSTLKIKGKNSLSPVTHQIIPDRIEAGTFIMMAGITGGEVLIRKAKAEHLANPISLFKSMGLQIEVEGENIFVRRSSSLKPIKVKTMPYPGFPTDLQPQLTALTCAVEGESHITETIFESRFSHIPELRKMGANIERENAKIKVKGGIPLKGTEVKAYDIRGGAALVLAGLCAEGKTHLLNSYYLDRGYEKIEEKISSLGANIKRVKGGNEDLG